MANLLMPVAIDQLGEITHLIEQANRNKRQTHIAGRLAVIARQDAEPTRIDREALVESELQTEVGDQIFPGVELGGYLRPTPVLPVGVVGRGDALIILHIGAIRDGIGQALLRHAAQKSLRVVATGLP